MTPLDIVLWALAAFAVVFLLVVAVFVVALVVVGIRNAWRDQGGRSPRHDKRNTTSTPPAHPLWESKTND